MMQCSWFRDGICHSCPQLDMSYESTLEQKRAAFGQLFSEFSLPRPVITPVRQNATGSRIRARIAVGGTTESPRIGFYDRNQRIVPVDQCPLHHSAINAWVCKLPALIRDCRIEPWDVETDRGELKHVIVTCSPVSRMLMVQLVLRSRESIDRVRRWWKLQQDESASSIPVFSIGLQPKRTSTIAGSEIIAISENTMLSIPFCGVELFFGPQSFIQTNYEVADELYKVAASWIREQGCTHLLDLYCGSGAFSLIAGRATQLTLGIDVSADSVRFAGHAARVNGIRNAAFVSVNLERPLTEEIAGRLNRNNDGRTSDLTDPSSSADLSAFDAVICNPPRRGLDPESLRLIGNINPRILIYSSCNAVTLRRDLHQLFRNCSMAIEQVQLFDMFPYTQHFETLVMLKRR